MKDNFSKEIDIIKDSYGEENVEISWGLYTYWC